jgi:glycosyltransferase involved in cell wall biosynthesis
MILAGVHPAQRTVSGGRIKTTYIDVPRGVLGELLLGRCLNKAGAEVVLASYNAPLAFGGIRVTAVHDIGFMRVPETFPPLLRRRIAWSVARSMRVSDLVATISEFSKSELLLAYPSITPEKIVVTSGAPDPSFRREQITDDDRERVRSSYQLPDRYVLVVGNLQPRKNLPRVIAAMEGVDIPLVVVGQRYWRSGSAEKSINDRTVWLGHVPSRDLPGIYAQCDLFVYASLYEGFGLPIVEAMAAGVPVLTSAIGAMMEVADGAAELCDPYSVASIRQSIQLVLENPAHQSDLVAKGMSRAAMFDWNLSATNLVDGISRVQRS